jgi:hypothetical protein
MRKVSQPLLSLLAIGGWSIARTAAFGTHYSSWSSTPSTTTTSIVATSTTKVWLSSSNNQQHLSCSDDKETEGCLLDQRTNPQPSRRSFLTKCCASAVTAVVALPSASSWAIEGPTSNEVAPPKVETDATGVTVYKTRSGLQYIELEAPPSPSPLANQNQVIVSSSPRYGQLCVISYTAYMKLPKDTSKQKFDQDLEFVLKHGNAKMIPGLDEGIHTMTVGSTRRIIIPPKLGFVEGGLGPLPEYPWDRWKLNSLMDDMVTQQGGNLIYDVTLLKIMDDEADQGYYEDSSLTGEEFEELQRILNKKAGNTV